MQRLKLQKKSRKNKRIRNYFSKINIIKYGGGPAAIDTFRIYTTGIADDGNMGQQSYGYEWNSFVIDRVLELIPSNYTNIEIYHHDILYNKETSEEKQKQIDFINRIVVQNDLLKTRVSVSIFLKSILNINTSSPFIIFDYAHLFTYITPSISSCNTHIMINNMLLPTGSAEIPREYNGTPLSKSFNIENIKSVYLGYKDDTHIRSNYIINFTDVFTVNKDGIVNTYIDKLFMRKLPTKINETLIPKDVTQILLHAIRQNIKKKIGSQKFNDTFARTDSLSWVENIILSLDDKHIDFTSLIISATDIAIKKIELNMDKNTDFWLKFK